MILLFNRNDRRWLLPILLLTVATLAIYAMFVISDFRGGQKTDTYQITVEHESDLPSPAVDTPYADSTPTDSDLPDSSVAPDTDTTSYDSDTPADTDTLPADSDMPADNSILHATDVPEGSYIGNKNSEKYHRADCKYGDMVQDNNLIVFNTLEDALNSGYKPCGACHPDEQTPDTQTPDE